MYIRSVKLALDALHARHDGRTNDFECSLQTELFDQSLRDAIRFYENNGHHSEVDKILKIYVYRYVVDLAATPRADGRPYDARTIELFRKIADTQQTLPDVLTDPESEAVVAKYIELSIREYEAGHRGRN